MHLPWAFLTASLRSVDSKLSQKQDGDRHQYVLNCLLCTHQVFLTYKNGFCFPHSKTSNYLPTAKIENGHFQRENHLSPSLLPPVSGPKWKKCAHCLVARHERLLRSNMNARITFRLVGQTFPRKIASHTSRRFMYSINKQTYSKKKEKTTRKGLAFVEVELMTHRSHIPWIPHTIQAHFSIALVSVQGYHRAVFKFKKAQISAIH